MGKCLGFGQDHKCPMCKKVFNVFNQTDYVYKVGSKYFCGWNCYRAYQKGKSKQPYLKGETTQNNYIK